MTTFQQNETREFFNRHAAEWQSKALGEVPKRVNVIQERNDFVLDVIARREQTIAALDVGCGSGDLVCEIARRGVPATGVDYAAEMIALARAAAKEGGIRGTQFLCASIFDLDLAPESLDVISANGFIEYISYRELDRLLALAHTALRPGGSLVLGSRNRLFNLFSLNEYTMAEVEQGTHTALLKEAVAWTGEPALETMARMACAPLQPEDSRHADTGIGVTTRYQFTPVQLLQRLQRNGYGLTEIAPVHEHGVAPAFKKRHPEVHTHVSTLLHHYAGETTALIPYASTFMVHATRR